MSTFVISLGGSLVCPEAGKVDTAFLKKFRALILKYVKQGNRFAIIVGGGKLARAWQEAGRKLGVSDSRELDWIGIRATYVNAELVRAMFGKRVHGVVVFNPAKPVPKFKILIGAGYKPGHSTDYDAVVRAKATVAKTIVNLSNVEYVYDKDPRFNRDAKALPKLSWKEYRAMFGKKWKPGANTPFDVTAAREAWNLGLGVAFIGGKDLKNFERFLQGKKFDGTIIG